MEQLVDMAAFSEPNGVENRNAVAHYNDTVVDSEDKDEYDPGVDCDSDEESDTECDEDDTVEITNAFNNHSNLLRPLDDVEASGKVPCQECGKAYPISPSHVDTKSMSVQLLHSKSSLLHLYLAPGLFLPFAFHGNNWCSTKNLTGGIPLVFSAGNAGQAILICIIWGVMRGTAAQRPSRL
jgi:hypothetical protein